MEEKEVHCVVGKLTAPEQCISRSPAKFSNLAVNGVWYDRKQTQLH